MRKKSKTQDYLEAKVIVKYDGKIDLKKLWDEEVELDPNTVKNLSNASLQNN